MNDDKFDIDVLIAGAGPAGLTLASDLSRRGVSVRIIDLAGQAFTGSRAKGVQPRTQEVFDDLGVIDKARRQGMDYPVVGFHLGPVVIPWRMQSKHAVTSDVPYPNTLLLPQNRTDAILHELLADSGVIPEFQTAFESFVQDAAGVTTLLSTGEHVRSRFLVGADGGGSAVRKAAGMTFVGETDPADRMLIVDAAIEGLSRRRWHMWPGAGGRGVAACPLPGTDQFQVMIRLDAEDEVDLAEESVAGRFHAITGRRLHGITWSSVFRPNVRLVDHYRQGRVFLAGDAAHVHTPAGGQGLNTGIQDAYNMGWKLGQVLSGADAALLDTYEQERRPVAAGVLALSNALYAKIGTGTTGGLRRGDQERQLGLSYAGGPLAPADAMETGSLRAGDRAPDAECHAFGASRLFDILRGPHFTLLAFGAAAEQRAGAVCWPLAGAELRAFAVRREDSGEQRGVLLDSRGDVHRRYGATGDLLVLIRPDGYIAHIAAPDNADGIAAAVRRVTGMSTRSQPMRER
jgi:2-polyprenyl-6-methoxyphenol hydroxylase-like FAD-dependent oxidoreductase